MPRVILTTTSKQTITTTFMRGRTLAAATIYTQTHFMIPVRDATLLDATLVLAKQRSRPFLTGPRTHLPLPLAAWTSGHGKTAIAQTFAEQCQRDGILGATYFFTGVRPGPAPGTTAPLLDSRISLMSVFHGLDEQSGGDILIVQPFLRLTINKFPSAVVIIDGLDECDGDSIQGEIVRLILGLERHSLPLLFFVSSRPEPVIRYAFGSSPRSSLACLLLDQALHPDHDIRHFLHKEFERIYAEMGMSPISQPLGPRPKQSKSSFEDHAHPMDRLDAILQIPSESASSSAAKGVIAASAAFQELDGLYLHILRKYQNRVELAKILRAIMHFSSRLRDPAPPDLLELSLASDMGSTHYVAWLALHH
ncbi:hypothetical protein BD779DRAFT_1679488 [Infundibulicybe gibba]|nr:hypothetical protein BD779DRAFT_1679488 [Infundibulicybe gibba]